MTIVSMKKPDTQDYADCPVNPYGYGLCINLTDDQVAALGLTMMPPAAGSKVGIRGMAFVCSVTSDVEGEGAPVGVCLRLQITDLEVTPAGGGMADSAASMLYSA